MWIRGEDGTQSLSFQMMKCVDCCGEHHIKNFKQKFETKQKFKAKKPSKSTYNPLIQVDYSLFQKIVPIGFVLLSIPTTMQILKNSVGKFSRKVPDEPTDDRTNERTEVKLKVLLDFIRDQ